MRVELFDRIAQLEVCSDFQHDTSVISASFFSRVCTLTEIISKIKEPPPLCRPILSVDEAPLDVIQVVKQAWSEEPERRPTFEEIFKQVGHSPREISSNFPAGQSWQLCSVVTVFCSLSPCSLRASPKGRRRTLSTPCCACWSSTHPTLKTWSGRGRRSWRWRGRRPTN